MHFGVLGPLEVRHGDDVVDVGSRQQRLVLVALLAAAGRPVAPDALVDVIWGDAPPRSSHGTLQTYVSRLRRCFDQATDDPPRLELDEAGYRLVVDRGLVDHTRFEQLADEGRTHLESGRADLAADRLVAALALWRGPAFAELAGQTAFAGLATRLEERRLAAVEDRVEADLRLGRHAALVGELHELVVQHPLREGLRSQLALALYRSGRQADALAAVADARTTLREELGIDPGRALQELETAILGQDRSLDAPSTARPATPAVTVPASPGTPAAQPGTPGLVGRDDELAVLRGALAEADTDARFVVVEGDPGIGKTRLVEELHAVATAAGSVVAWGRADESGATPALWPWLPVLRTLRAHADAGADEVDRLLAGEVPVTVGRGAAVRFEAFDAVAQALEAAGRDRPAVVLLEDLQWADEASLALLSALVGRLHRGVLVVATVRPLEVGRADAVVDALGVLAARRGSRRLVLRGLEAPDIAALLDDAGLIAGSPDLACRIHGRAEGNPFYAIELARLLDEQALARHEVPATVRDVIRRRLGRLPSDTQDLLAVAAVVGRDVELHLLARAAGLSELDCLETIEPALVDRLLVEHADRPGTVRFTHTLVREVLVDGLTSLRRARLHLDVADAIETGGAGRDDAEIVAEHLWRAAPVGVGGRAAAALEQAAEVAVHRVSYTAAEDHLDRAVRLRRATATGDDDLRAELASLVRLLEVMQTTRYFQGTDRAVLARAQELAVRFGLDGLSRQLTWFEWAALSTAARVHEAAELAARFVGAMADDADPAVRATGHGMQGTSFWQLGRLRDAVAELDAGVGLLAGLGPPADALEGEQRMVTASFHLTCHAIHGDRTADEVRDGFVALTGFAPPLAVPSICGLGGSTAMALGRFDHLAEHVDRALAADPSSQFAFWGGQLLMQRGVVDADAGRVDDGLASFAEGQARYLRIGARTSLSNFQAAMAGRLAVRGRVDAAAALAEEARRSRGDEVWAEPMVLVAEAFVAHARGEAAAAARRLATARRVASSQSSAGFARRAEAVAAELGLEMPVAVPG